MQHWSAVRLDAAAERLAQREIDESARQSAVEQSWRETGQPVWSTTEVVEGGLRLFSSAQAADRYNNAMLKALPGKHHGFNATDTGDDRGLNPVETRPGSHENQRGKGEDHSCCKGFAR